MRTTFRLDDDLLRQAKRVAADEGRTLTSLVEDGLREQVARRLRDAHQPFHLTTVHGRLAPGITEADLMSNERTLDLLDDLG